MTPNADIQIEIDEEKGIIEVYVSKMVVKEVSDPLAEIHWKDALKYDSKASEGDMIKIHMPGETLGRIAAQSAKQIIMQKILKAEQENIYDKYFPLAGTLMSGEIRRIENDNIILGLEVGEAVLPPKELSPKDSFKRGEIIKFLIKRVFSEGKGPLVLATRYMNDFVAELIRKEVPEVAENIVKIFAISREPGIKSKVAVYSTDKAIDPVGAIVGMNGNRVLAITKELRGERIDVIAWSNSPERFIASALTPAEVVKVHLVDPDEPRGRGDRQGRNPVGGHRQKGGQHQTCFQTDPVGYPDRQPQERTSAKSSKKNNRRARTCLPSNFMKPPSNSK